MAFFECCLFLNTAFFGCTLLVIGASRLSELSLGRQACARLNGTRPVPRLASDGSSNITKTVQFKEA